MRLVRLTIEAAAAPVIAASFKLALIYSYHDNRHLVFCVVLGRLYSNVLLSMLNCRDPLFGGGSNPNTMAGAARLSEPNTVLSILKSKFSLSSRQSRGGSVSYGSSRDQFASLDRAYGNGAGEKMGSTLKTNNSRSSRTYQDYDLEAGGRRTSAAVTPSYGIQFPRRGSGNSVGNGPDVGGDRESMYSLTSFDGRSRLSSYHRNQKDVIDEEDVPASPTTADVKPTSELLPSSKVEFITPLPVAVARPTGDRRDSAETRR